MPAIHITANPDDPYLPVRQINETDVEYTDRLVRERKEGMFRQCSIGWHDECSDPYGQECTCAHHQIAKEETA